MGSNDGCDPPPDGANLPIAFQRQVYDSICKSGIKLPNMALLQVEKRKRKGNAREFGDKNAQVISCFHACHHTVWSGRD